MKSRKKYCFLTILNLSVSSESFSQGSCVTRSSAKLVTMSLAFGGKGRGEDAKEVVPIFWGYYFSQIGPYLAKAKKMFSVFMIQFNCVLYYLKLIMNELEI